MFFSAFVRWYRIWRGRRAYHAEIRRQLKLISPMPYTVALREIVRNKTKE